MQNYYYDPDKSGLEMIAFEDGNLSYEFDILAFWATKDGVVYSASDSGCSCPIPFEGFTSIESLERVGSLGQAEAIFENWNQGKVDPQEKRKLIAWIEVHLK